MSKFHNPKLVITRESPLGEVVNNYNKFEYYWNKKKRKESNRPLDWDKIITFTIIYPTYLLFGILFVLSKWFQ